MKDYKEIRDIVEVWLRLHRFDVDPASIHALVNTLADEPMRLPPAADFHFRAYAFIGDEDQISVSRSLWYLLSHARHTTINNDSLYAIDVLGDPGDYEVYHTFSPYFSSGRFIKVAVWDNDDIYREYLNFCKILAAGVLGHMTVGHITEATIPTRDRNEMNERHLSFRQWVDAGDYEKDFTYKPATFPVGKLLHDDDLQSLVGEAISVATVPLLPKFGNDYNRQVQQAIPAYAAMKARMGYGKTERELWVTLADNIAGLPFTPCPTE